MSANTELLKRMIGVMVSIAMVTTAGLALGRGQGPDVVYEPPSYVPPPRAHGPATAAQGQAVFEAKGCVGCHTTDGSARVGPSLRGSWGQPIVLANGTAVTFDEAYLRESLATPLAKARAGYPASMPSFEGVIKEKEIRALIEYLKVL